MRPQPPSPPSPRRNEWRSGAARSSRSRLVLPGPPGPPGAAWSTLPGLVPTLRLTIPRGSTRVVIGSPGPSSTNGTTVVSTAIRGRSLRGGSVLGVTADRSRGVGARTRAAASEARRSLESATLAPRSLERFPPERMPSSATFRSLAHLKGHGGPGPPAVGALLTNDSWGRPTSRRSLKSSELPPSGSHWPRPPRTAGSHWPPAQGAGLGGEAHQPWRPRRRGLAARAAATGKAKGREFK